MSLPIYIDIDGTLTDSPDTRWGRVIPGRIEAVKRLIAEGNLVVLWSAGSDEYAKEFAKKYELKVHAALGKPDICVDDKHDIRLNGLTVVGPNWLNDKLS